MATPEEKEWSFALLAGAASNAKDKLFVKIEDENYER
jgi:hypothetical protein